MMQPLIEPVIGQWYQDMQRRLFEVVALDEDAIEIQFYDGDVEEFDRETWLQLNVQATAEPNDGKGPFDDMDADDLSYTDDEFHPVNWQSMIDEL